MSITLPVAELPRGVPVVVEYDDYVRRRDCLR